MTSHELAHKLLALPDAEVIFSDEIRPETVQVTDVLETHIYDAEHTDFTSWDVMRETQMSISEWDAKQPKRTVIELS